MSGLKAMKFKVNSPEHSKQIQEKLFELGYYWGMSGKMVQYTDRPALYANYFGDKTLTYSYTLEDFEDKGDYNCVEHFLVNGKFVTKDYWSAPETTYEPLPTEDDDVTVKIYGPNSPQYLAAKEKLEKEIAPTITPRVEFLRQRVSEILAAMTRFNDMKLVPPSEWHLELEDIFEEIKNAK